MRYQPLSASFYKKNRSKFSANDLKKKEGDLILSKLDKSDLIILLDDQGKHYSSIDFSKNGNALKVKLSQLISNTHTHNRHSLYFITHRYLGCFEDK